jgi:hypothetical protein
MKIAFLLWAFLATIAAVCEMAFIQQSRLKAVIQSKDVRIAYLGQRLAETENSLATANSRLGYLDGHGRKVLITAYTTKQGELSSRGLGYWFANGERTRGAFGVSGNALPQDHVLNVALSRSAQATLHAKMNDYLALWLKGSDKMLLARFVDTTSSSQPKPVVDVFFRNQTAASEWGCKGGYAVDVSRRGAPF